MRPKPADFLRLAYSDADGHKKGIIRLDDATDVRPSTATSGRTHGLDGRTDDWEMEVVTPERTWRLRAASESEMYAWLLVLCAARRTLLPPEPEPEPAPVICFQVKTLTGQTWQVQARPSDTIAFVKAQVQGHSRIPAEEQCIVTAGRELTDECSVSTCGVVDGATLSMVLKLAQ